MKRSTIITTLLAFTGASALVAADDTAIDQQVESTQSAHNIPSWWEKELVEADVVIDFRGNRIVDGTFTFEAHGPRSRYDRKDGSSIIFDGETAWVTPADAEAPKGRFHVLTWPWFIMAPFKMQGEGINLSELSAAEVNGTEYITLFQTFGPQMGDTPDDWYRFFINPETQLVEGMSYIVTYGKSEEQANEQASIIWYDNYNADGDPAIAHSYEFWLWDTESKSVEGEAPKGTGTITDVSYPDASDDTFAIPSDSRELPLPDAKG